MKRLTRVLKDLLYPPLCIHCRQWRELSDAPFCVSCQSQLRLLDPNEHCKRCFCLIEDATEAMLCHACRKSPALVDRAAAALDYRGPAGTLARHLKYGDRCYLAPGMAAYLLAQWSQLDWPLPDIVVPVPMHWLRQFSRGYNQSRLLADALAAMLQVPLIPALARRLGAPPQAGLTRKQRCELGQELFYLRRAQGLADKVVLIVDDVRTTGSTLERCAEALQAAGPCEIQALTFAQA